MNVFDKNSSLFVNLTEKIFDNGILVVYETVIGASVPLFCFTKAQVGDSITNLHSDITNFHVAKASHDFLDLSNGQFSTIAQVLRHTSTFQGSATIHLDKDSTVKLDGVTRAQLAQHHDVFFFG